MSDVFIRRPAEQARKSLLGQLLNAQTAAEELYSPDDGVACTIKTIVVCNTTAAARLFSIYHKEDGATYTSATALYYNKTISTNDTIPIEIEIYMNNPSGSLGVQADQGGSICFSAYGEEIQTRAR